MRQRSYATLISLATLAGILSGCGSHHAKAAGPTTVAPTTTVHKVKVKAKAKVKKAAPAPKTCPLTDLPAPKGGVPARPALAVKVENLPVARPQYGFSAADIVYEEPVEGGITRFIVIFQCNDTPRIEPIRSGRLIDPDLVMQYGAHPLFAYAGAIQPVVTKVDSSSLIDVGIFHAPTSDYWRDLARVAPHNLVSSTANLYAAGAAEHAPAVPPPPVFKYGSLLSGSSPASAVNIPYTYSDVTWIWQPQTKSWLRTYVGDGPAGQGEGGAVNATNVVVMKEIMFPSPYVEDVTGTHENVLALLGSGAAQVFRNGKVINGTWNRPALANLTVFKDAHGRVIKLAPGPTWIELVPTTIGVTVTP